MVAKEKAENLVGFYTKELLKAKYRVNGFVIRELAKQCSLIALQEIINANPHSNPFNTGVYSTMDYWLQVRKEIEDM